jgi:hypothetical protein
MKMMMTRTRMMTTKVMEMEMAKMRMDRMMKAAVGKYYSHFTNKLVNH